jgi:hypothetical protein
VRSAHEQGHTAVIAVLCSPEKAMQVLLAADGGAGFDRDDY